MILDQQASDEKDRPGLASRKAAARLLAVIIDANSSMDGLTDNDHGHPDYLALNSRDRALVRAILMCALRYRLTIQAMIDRRLDRPLPGNARTLSHILHVGAAQLLFLSVPDRAAIDIAVTQAKADPRTRRFANLVNAVLRSIQRGGERAKTAALAQTVNAPQWFADSLRGDYGERLAEQIIAMHRHEAPMDFTVKSDPEGWARKLDGFVLPTGSVRVPQAKGAVAALPGYQEGEWWVQDAAAALPVLMMGNLQAKSVADLCAAPGGKTAQMAHAGAQVTAFDLSRNRLARLQENMQRLGLSVSTAMGDIRKIEPETRFDAVLLDAPCSSTGTVRRHPDIPWTKSPEEVQKLADLQRDLLMQTLRFVKPGGTIIFSNCSLNKLEGEDLITSALRENSRLVTIPVQPDEILGAESFITDEGWLRTTPADWPDDNPARAGLDGFFAARLQYRE